MALIKAEQDLALEELQKQRATEGKPRPARLKPAWTNDKVVLYKAVLASTPRPLASKKAAAGNKGGARILVGSATNTHRDGDNDDDEEAGGDEDEDEDEDEDRDGDRDGDGDGDGDGETK